MDNQSAISVSDEIRGILKETQKNLRDLSISQKETDRQIKEFQAGQRELQAAQTETDRQMRETDKKLKEVIGDFGNRWGKLGENLVKGGLVQRLKERGILVEKVITNVKNASAEFDIVAVNGREIVVVEVKATLDPADVQKFTEKIKKFKIWWPEFKDKTVYGAMAFLIKANRQASDSAQKRGFFVIEAVGDVIIKNDKEFQPKVFS